MRVIVWAWVPGYEHRYEVSNHGHVRSWLPWRGTPVPRALSTPLDSYGYPGVRLTAAGSEQRTVRVHVLVALAFIGPRPDGMEARHLDGDKTNVAVANLRYGTSSENRQDALRHGHHANQNTDATHCLRGHPFSEENTYRWNGWRRCRTCDADRARERTAAAGVTGR
jgi:hypothetical protein